MRKFNAVVLADIRESIRAKWFLLYSFIFGGAVILLFSLGITESQVMGFTGLSRMLVTYIQLCVAILPIMILITTVRTVVGDRESNVMEYILSFPVSLSAYFWGKFCARFIAVLVPVFTAFVLALMWGLIKDLEVPWGAVAYYSVLLCSLACCFLGIGMFLSTTSRRQERALGLAFLIWLGFLVFLDIILIGVMLQNAVHESIIIGISLLNPLQVFRTGAMLLFDPELVVLGPASYVILDQFGKIGFMVFAALYPMLLGLGFSFAGYQIFRRGDLV